MSEFWGALRETIGELAKLDPRCTRFGAAHHRYALAPTLDLELPVELRTFAATVGGGGAGPYYGMLPLARVQPIAEGLPIAHLGCGYTAVARANRSIWIVAPPLGLVEPMHSSLMDYFIDWVDRLGNAEWPQAFVPPGQCALQSALSGYFAVHEQRLGLAPGTLAGDDLTAALEALGPGAIEIAGSPPLFAVGDPVDPCVSCARVLENLAASGLRPDVVKPGVAPIPER